MLPVLFRVPAWVPLLGNQPLTSFGVALLVGLLAGGVWFARRAAPAGVPRNTAWEMVALAAVAGLVGARLYYLAANPGPWHGGWMLLSARSGLAGMGAFLGGAAAMAWRGRRLHVPPARLADAAAPPLALLYGIARIGSFLAGADYGRPTGSFLGTAFPRGNPATTPANLLARFGVVAPASARVGEQVLVHPTQLYEAVGALLVAWWLGRRRPAHGTFAWCLVLLGLLRFAVEFLRLQTERMIGPFALDQLVALVLVVGGLVLLRLPSREEAH
ncbi:MAG TPA: prolipoprotein diacylglyceryl transferase family protein [Longimicrobiales bacterium]|nr:prolipoprotein diacylglyceryl transferase family protein [Longimicrobiales bacterium]